MANNVISIILRGQDLTGPAFASSARRLVDLGKAARGMFAVFAAGAAIGAVTSITKGLIDNTMAAIKDADALNELAQRAGIAVNDFSELAAAASLAGVSAEDLVTATKKLSEEMTRSGRGNESVIKEMMAISDQFDAAGTSAAKTALAVDRFGKSGQKLIPFLNAGSEEIRKQMEEMRQLGQTVGPGFGAHADRFTDAQKKMQMAMKGLWLQVAQDVLPTLNELAEKTIAWIKHGNNLEKVAHKIGFAFNFAMRWVEDFNLFSLSGIGGAAKFADAWRKAGEDMARAREEMAKAAEGKGDGGMIVDPEDVAKAQKLYESLWLSRMRGAEAIREKERQHWQQQLDEIGKLQIEGLALSLDAHNAYQQKITEQKRLGEEIRAELDFHAREGQVEGYMQALNSKESLDLQWLDAQRNTAQTYQQLWETSFLNIRAALQNFINSAMLRFSEGFSSAIADIVTGVKSAKEAFTQLGNSMLHMLIKWIAQMAINTVLAGGYQAAISKTAVAAMAPVLAANTAAATAAAIATFGGATAAGAAVLPVMTANVALAQGLFSGLGGVAHSGLDMVPSTGTYLLEGGEGVVKKGQNARLTAMLDNYESGGSMGGQMVHVTIELEGQPIYDGIGRASRDGRLHINARAVS